MCLVFVSSTLQLQNCSITTACHSLPTIEEAILGQFGIGHVDQTAEFVLNVDDGVHVRQTVRHRFNYDIRTDVTVEHLMAIGGAQVGAIR